MLQSIDLSKKPQKAKLYLAKPNKTILGIIKEAFAITYNPKLSGISELNFSIPAMVEKNHQQIKNPNITNIRDSYLIKYVCGNTKEWFVINQPKKSMSENGDVLTYHAFSLPHELIHRNIRSYTVESKNATEVLTDTLLGTAWNIGYIDPFFNSLYRSFQVDVKSILDFINDIATTFNAVIVWDTENITVSLYKQDNYGNNQGLRVTYGKLLQGVEQTIDPDQMATRFIPTGQNGLTINSCNPTGQNYIDDFSYFISGFSQDDEGNVLSHSPWMSDGLCQALIAHKALIDSNSGVYSSLLSQLQTAQETFTTKDTELSDLKLALKIIQDNLSMAQQDGDDTTSLLAQESAQQALVDAKQAEVTTANQNIATIQTQMVDFQDTISLENNLTQEQWDELHTSFIREKDWSNEFHINAQDLYDAALIEFDKVRTPPISVTLSIVNFLEILEEQKNWNKLKLGDIITVYYDKLDIDIKATITEFVINHEDRSISLTVTSVKEASNDEQKFAQTFKQMVAASKTVQNNNSNIRNISAIQQTVTDLQTQPIDASVTPIIAGVNNSVIVDDKGVTARNPFNLLEYLQMNYKSLIITQDGGQTVKSAITPEGINAETIVGALILGENLIIQTADGKVQMLPRGITVYDENGTLRARFGDTSATQNGSSYGLLLNNPSGQVIIGEGMAQAYNIQETDNVDGNGHPLKLKFYVPNEVLEVRSVKLAFSLEKFRAYETGAASGGGGATTSDNGGGATTSAGGDHSHLMFNVNSAYTSNAPYGVQLIAANNGLKLEGINCSDVSGDFYTKGSSGNHQHNSPVHSHDVVLPQHQHDLVFGIYEGATATGVNVYVDGVLRDNSSYTTSQSNIELKQWIQTPGWHTIELTSTTLGRISASVFILNYLSM